MKRKINKKKIIGAAISIVVILIICCLVGPRLFSSSTVGDRRGAVQFIKNSQPVDLSRFSSQVNSDLEQPGQNIHINGNQNNWSAVRTPEVIKQDFDTYVHSAPLPKIPLFSEQVKRPTPATASLSVAVAARGIEPHNTAPENTDKRGFSYSFNNEGTEGNQPVTMQEGGQFHAKLFGDVKVATEAQVQIQVLDPFILNGCEIKKNTVLTALAKRSGNRMDILLSSLPACNGLMNCNYTGYSIDGQRGLYINAVESTLDKSSQTAVETAKREASQAASGLLTAYGGVAGRVLGSGLNDVLNGSGKADNTVTLTEGTKILFKNK